MEHAKKTKAMVEPNETGGGILADDMGMGKTLSILALVLRTLNAAHDWAIRVDVNGATSEMRGERRRSAATLIVASSDRKCSISVTQVRAALRLTSQ